MIDWSGFRQLDSLNFICGHCGSNIASDRGYLGTDMQVGKHVYIYICHVCGSPTFFDAEGFKTPGSIYGGDVLHISDADVSYLYDEARRCISINAFTASVMCCRKLIMHIAVSKGADENKSFKEYVDYLSKNNFIPFGSSDWVDQIRDKGNEANHEIKVMSEDDAKELLTFMEMLLKLIYEFPAKTKINKT